MQFPRRYYPWIDATRPNRGFALLITITLLAFLVLLLVSLASLTRVETQVAGNNQQLSQARQNALMALNIALGQLQNTVGPDQRTTARADLADPSNINGFTTLPQAGQARWTSAWGNANKASYTDLPNAIPVDSNSGSVNKPVLLNWLVSGNEAVTIQINSSTGQIASPSAPGNTVANATMKFAPTNTISFGSETPSVTALKNANALTANLHLSANGTPSARLLVGPNTVGDASSNASIDANADYVVAPVVPIQVPANTIPGAGTNTAPITIGNYAYWVGDEGIKAKANLVDTYLQLSSPAVKSLLTARGLSNTAIANAANAAKAYSSFTAQHAGISFMDKNPGLSNYTTSPLPTIGSDYSYNNYNYSNLPGNFNNSTWVDSSAPSSYTSSLDGVLSIPQMPLLANSNPSVTSTTSASSARLQTAMQYRYHDTTTNSYSVLSDSYAGGLKKDLSAALAPNWSAPSSHETADSNPLFKPLNSNDYGIPTWGQLRSYISTRINTATNCVALKMPTANGMGISPLISYMALGFKIYQDSTSHKIYIAIYPLLGLYNPYTFDLDGPPGASPNAKLGFGIRQVGALTFTLEIKNAGGTYDTIFSNLDAKSLMGSGASYFVFPITLGTMTSGRGQTISIQTSGQNYTANTNTLKQLSGTNTQGFNYVTALASSTPLTLAQQTAAYKITVGGTGGEMDVVFAGNNAALSSYTPPSPTGPTDTNGWYHAIQHVRFSPPSGTTVMTTDPIHPSLTGLPTTPNPAPFGAQSDIPLTVLRVQAMLGGITSKYNDNINIGMDPNYQLRWFAQSNIRAPLATRTTFEYYSGNTGNCTFGGICSPTNSAGDYSKYGNFEGISSGTPTPPSSIVNSIPVGYYHRKGGLTRLFDIPRDDIPLLSLGQLQNANLSLIDGYPAYPLGNSLADFRIPGTSTFVSNAIEKPGTSNINTANSSISGTDAYYDISWHLNRSLWDKYFVSTVPAGAAISGTSVPSPTPPVAPWAWTQTNIDQHLPLPNGRMLYVTSGTGAPTLANIANTNANQAYDQASANLILAGGFNVNSTSEQAWRALIGGTAYVPYRAYGATNSTNAYTSTTTGTKDRYYNEQDLTTPLANIAVSRNVSPVASADLNIQNNASSGRRLFFNGNREISPAMTNAGSEHANAALALPQVVAKLAHDIVTEVKKRGPFLSMGDFVNRRLVDTTATGNLGATGLKGTLQAALDNNTKATAPVSGGTSTTSGSYRLDSTQYPISVNFSGWNYLNGSVGLWDNSCDTWVSSTLTAPIGSSYIVNNMKGTNDSSLANETYMLRYGAGSNGVVTQADLLAAFGAGMVSRSDTFIIRTYGEVVNPMTSKVDGRAWCEAVVQRLPFYLDQTDSALTGGSNLGDATPPSQTNTTNQSLGRRFKIISFRWLTPNDI